MFFLGKNNLTTSQVIKRNNQKGNEEFARESENIKRLHRVLRRLRCQPRSFSIASPNFRLKDWSMTVAIILLFVYVLHHVTNGDPNELLQTNFCSTYRSNCNSSRFN